MGLTAGAYLQEEKGPKAEDGEISTLFHYFVENVYSRYCQGKCHNQSNVPCQPASNCILTQCNALQTGGLDVC